MQTTFLELKKNLRKSTDSFPALQVALLGDNPTQLLNTAIKGYAISEQLNLSIYEADYDQVDAEVLNTSSSLYQHSPKFICIFNSFQKLQKKFHNKENVERKLFAEAYLNSIENYIQVITHQLKTNILIANFPEADNGIYGNYANKTEASFLFQIRKINTGLMELSIKYKNLFINDVALLNARYGLNQSVSPSLYINSNMAYNLDFLPVIAKNTIDIIKAIHGKIKKCLILDLDNTLWGGIIGDDGLDGIQIGNLGVGEAYTQLQRWAKQLKERGIILTVCSKNNEETAKEPFEKHPDMVLKLNDIAVFVANWNNKADNIRHIQSVLNIGFDSMVFLDDNPAERKIVSDNVPDITVPELPEDPALYVDYLQQLNLFETASLTEEDTDRTKQYQEEAKRTEFKHSFVNEQDFLKSLQMICKVNAFTSFEVPRIAQLTQRSNQFNLRTIRYNEEEVSALSKNPNYITFSFKLSDTFGDYGLVSVIILELTEQKNIFINTWLMSCRVLKRELEQLVLNTVVKAAQQKGVTKIIGEYIPTSKNSMVQEHYTKLGFSKTEKENIFELEVALYKSFTHQITVTE